MTVAIQQISLAKFQQKAFFIIFHFSFGQNSKPQKNNTSRCETKIGQDVKVVVNLLELISIFTFKEKKKERAKNRKKNREQH